MQNLPAQALDRVMAGVDFLPRWSEYLIGAGEKHDDILRGPVEAVLVVGR